MARHGRRSLERDVKASLADSFRSGNGRKAKWDGQTVHSVLDISVNDGDQIEVNRISASSARAQAVKLGVDKGTLRVNGIVVPLAAIWTHTSPQQCVLEVVGRRARSVDIWNSWSFDGVDSSWLANAAMIVERDGDNYVLRCSDGIGDPSFDDLVVKISIRRHD